MCEVLHSHTRLQGRHVYQTLGSRWPPQHQNWKRITMKAHATSVRSFARALDQKSCVEGVFNVTYAAEGGMCLIQSCVLMD
jgi:hypothetical protein